MLGRDDEHQVDDPRADAAEHGVPDLEAAAQRRCRLDLFDLIGGHLHASDKNSDKNTKSQTASTKCQ